MRFGQRARLLTENADAFRRCKVGNMYDQGVEARPPLRGVDSRHRFRISRVRSKAVNSLGRDCDRLPLENQPRGLGDRLVANRKHARIG